MRAILDTQIEFPSCTRILQWYVPHDHVRDAQACTDPMLTQPPPPKREFAMCLRKTFNAHDIRPAVCSFIIPSFQGFKHDTVCTSPRSLLHVPLDAALVACVYRLNDGRHCRHIAHCRLDSRFAP